MKKTMADHLRKFTLTPQRMQMIVEVFKESLELELAKPKQIVGSGKFLSRLWKLFPRKSPALLPTATDFTALGCQLSSSSAGDTPLAFHARRYEHGQQKKQQQCQTYAPPASPCGSYEPRVCSAPSSRQSLGVLGRR
ncbi:hypothetical protein B0H19DRAFT_536644 [Mycena capillaripes]|nr:hypothetical protein B0H19DRAFT_536644 [Mycena capillaripes]